MMQKQVDLFELISVLELPAISLDWVELDYYSAQTVLREFKKIVEKQRRMLAKKYHPDKQGGDLERMKVINEVADLLLILKIQPPQRTTIVFRSYGGTTSASTSSVTNSTGCW